MADRHAARPRLVLVVDNSSNITFGLGKARKKLKADAFDASRGGSLYNSGPEAGRNAVPRPHGADMTIVGAGVLAELPSRGPSVDHFLKVLHRGGTLQNVARLVNTKRSGFSNTMRSAMDETPAERLKSYRIIAGYEYAEDFSKRHPAMKPSTHRARESGGRGIPAKVAKEYAKIFKRYKATRHVTAHLILYGDPEEQTADEPSILDSIKSDYDNLLSPLTEDELQRMWPSIVESVKLVTKSTRPSKARRSRQG